MAGNSCNVRIVLLGGGGVGKTAIVKRFLFHSFCDKYRATVEDLFFKEFNYGNLLLKVRILLLPLLHADTSCRVHPTDAGGLFGYCG